jgi:hypothetical protein
MRVSSSSRDRVGDLDFRSSGDCEKCLDCSEAGKNGRDCSSDSVKGVTENVLALELYVIQRLNCRKNC